MSNGCEVAKKCAVYGSNGKERASGEVESGPRFDPSCRDGNRGITGWVRWAVAGRQTEVADLQARRG